MSKGPHGEKRPAGVVECAHEVFQIAVGEKEEVLPSGRRNSGIAGAAARSNSLSPKKRKEIAEKAATARWKKNESNIGRTAMTGKERLLGTLFPKGGGAELVNLKFLPRDIDITEEELCLEVLDALEEHRSEKELKLERIGPYLKSM